MPTPYLQITLPKNAMKNVSKHWMLLAVLSLALAGILSIFLALLRTPGVEAMIPYRDFFHTALVAHVDLSVLVWMLSIGGLLFSTITHPRYYLPAIIGVWLAIIGTVLIAVTPFTGESYPLMNNYIPVLQRLPFFLGLSLVGCGVLFQTVICLASFAYTSDRENPVLEQAGIYVAAVITLIAFLCFVFSHKQLQAFPITDMEYYYEQLFWGGGHILQFTYTQLMLVVWLVLAAAAGVTVSLSKKWLYLLLTLNMTVVLPSPILYFFHTVNTPEYTSFFTDQMRYMGGTVAAIIGLVLVVNCVQQRKQLQFTPATAALICSLALFGAGGMLGHMIRGVNVVIPAHYHGSIVGISLAFMGLIYYIMPRFGYSEFKSRAARWQPYIYAGGQFLHISGLAWSGGYGVLRKTPGAVLSLEAKMGMGLMGLGGLIAVIGGVIFVVVVGKKWLVTSD